MKKTLQTQKISSRDSSDAPGVTFCLAQSHSRPLAPGTRQRRALRPHGAGANFTRLFRRAHTRTWETPAADLTSSRYNIYPDRRRRLLEKMPKVNTLLNYFSSPKGASPRAGAGSSPASKPKPASSSRAKSETPKREQKNKGETDGLGMPWGTERIYVFPGTLCAPGTNDPSRFFLVGTRLGCCVSHGFLGIGEILYGPVCTGGLSLIFVVNNRFGIVWGVW